MTTANRTPARPGRVPVCGERTQLPRYLVQAAVALAAPGTAEPDDVQRHLRCTLQQHTTGDHYAIVMDLRTPDTAAWTHWTQGNCPETLLLLTDCRATGPAPAHEPCCEYTAHPGAHTYEINDPFASTAIAG